MATFSRTENLEKISHTYIKRLFTAALLPMGKKAPNKLSAH